MKKCTVCGIEKELCNFPKKDKNTYRSKCKICFNERKRELIQMSDEEKKIIINNIRNAQEEKRKDRENNKIIKMENKKRKLLEKEEIKKTRRKKLCLMCGESSDENFYKNRKTKCKKCILSNSNKKYQSLSNERKNEYKHKLKIWRKENLIKFRVLSAKHRSNRKGIIFELTEEIVIKKLEKQENKCYISKIPLTFNENDWHCLSLDRLDSNLGYTIDNTILVTKFVNISKNSLSYSEYVKLVKEVLNNL